MALNIELKFDDPQVERAYVESERSNRRPGTRLIIAIAVVTLIGYIGLNPLHFSRAGVLAYNASASILIGLLIAFYAFTYTRSYISRPWTDILIFTAIAIPMVMLVEALASQANVTGISRAGMSIIQFAILVMFASLGFVASRKYFWAWAIVLLVIYVTLLGMADRTGVSKFYTFSNFSTFFVFAAFVNFDIDCRARATYRAKQQLEDERAKSEGMLYNILPEDIAQRIGRGEAVADSFSDVSVVFIDIVGFSRIAKALSPGMLVEMLNGIFQIADDAAEAHGIEKVKTIGDSYMAVSGGHASREADAAAAIAFGRTVIENIAMLAERSKIDIRIRVGIHTGPAVGGVIGTTRMAYDYWGDTMNIASRLEGAARPNGIAVSQATYYAARGSVAFSEPETLELKNVGEVEVYHVELAEADRVVTEIA